MFEKMPPYQRIGWLASVLLVGIVIYYYELRSGPLSAFWNSFVLALLCGCALAVLLMAGLEIAGLVREYRQGTLFPLRNVTFFVVCLSVVALPALAVYGLLGGQGLHESTYPLLPVFLWMFLRNLFLVKIDGVGLETKLGFRAPEYVPLFHITDVQQEEHRTTITTSAGKRIELLRVFFFPAIWARMQVRLKSLQERGEVG
ncbi:hypothetical protein QWY85_20170 [Neolewinella lacunae]|uniref:Uncharacterized protein n=1 Tax=Neolewinella lacunae TaxID=1517758 RepID=A0A923PLR3_9BACT|nr:hypothetical protein [Neolewinella lacunae]MBC6996375.1 hypothetical protein [Neolewinella lacunae]MDN3636998.1 hypothetical protein [Neolewinella lacunae]